MLQALPHDGTNKPGAEPPLRKRITTAAALAVVLLAGACSSEPASRKSGGTEAATTTEPIAPSSQAHGFSTLVGIQGSNFTINGKVTFPGLSVEGLLLNSRMVQAIFDDENRETVERWAYPDTGEWDPDRNTSEFTASLPLYAERGLNAVTVNLQGGNPSPKPGQNHQPWINTAFHSDGELKSAYLDRLDRVIRAADREGLVVILGYFYFGQDHRLQNEDAVVRATDNATVWLVNQGYTNVIVEIANESDVFYDHAILKPDRIHELIQRVRNRSQGMLRVSTSFGGGSIPPAAVVETADFILVHGNNQNTDEIAAMVQKIRSMPEYERAPKPIVFNEDSTTMANMEAALRQGASWGYYDKGLNDYRTGFQVPPINWLINTPEKEAFFNAVDGLVKRDNAAMQPRRLVFTTVDIPSATASLQDGFHLVTSFLELVDGSDNALSATFYGRQ